MRMRETVRSLRAFFILAGLLFGVPAAVSLVAQPIGLLSVAYLISFAFAVAYLYLGIRLRTLLATSPRQIHFVVFANGVLSGIQLIVNLIFGTVYGVFGSATALFVAWYLYTNVRRLSSSESAVTAAPCPPSDT